MPLERKKHFEKVQLIYAFALCKLECLGNKKRFCSAGNIQNEKNVRLSLFVFSFSFFLNKYCRLEPHCNEALLIITPTTIY